MKRRDFVKTVALSGMAIAATDLVGDLIAQSTQGKPLESQFKGLADIALGRGEAQRLHLRRHPLHAPDQLQRQRQRRQQRLRGLRRLWRRGGPRGARRRTGWTGRGRRLRRRRRNRRPWRGGIRRARHPQRRLGIREQPDRHRGRNPADHPGRDGSRQGQRHRQGARRRARAGARLHRYWATPSREEPGNAVARRQAGAGPACRRHRRQEQGRGQRQRLGRDRARVEVLRQLRGLVHRAGRLVGQSVVHRHRAQEQRDAVPHLHRRDDDRRLGDRRARADARERRAHRRRSRRVLHCAARSRWASRTSS